MGAMKQLTRDQLQSRKEKAVRFTCDVLGDPDRADEIADESLEDYAQRRKIQITNPTKGRDAIMATNKDLEDRVDELEQENAELQDQLDTIADIVAPADEDEDEDDEEEDHDQD